MIIRLSLWKSRMPLLASRYEDLSVSIWTLMSSIVCLAVGFHSFSSTDTPLIIKRVLHRCPLCATRFLISPYTIVRSTRSSWIKIAITFILRSRFAQIERYSNEDYGFCTDCVKLIIQGVYIRNFDKKLYLNHFEYDIVIFCIVF